MNNPYPNLKAEAAELRAQLRKYAQYERAIANSPLFSAHSGCLFPASVRALTKFDNSLEGFTDEHEALIAAVKHMTAHTGKNALLVSAALKPELIAALEDEARTGGMELRYVGLWEGRTNLHRLFHMLENDVAACVMHQCGFFGCLEETMEAIRLAHNAYIPVIVAVDPVVLGTLRSPADLKADMAVGQFGDTAFVAMQERYSKGGESGGKTSAPGLCAKELIAASERIYCASHYLCERLTALAPIERRFKTDFFDAFVLRVPEGLGAGYGVDISYLGEGFEGCRLFRLNPDTDKRALDECISAFGAEAGEQIEKIAPSQHLCWVEPPKVK